MGILIAVGLCLGAAQPTGSFDSFVWHPIRLISTGLIVISRGVFFSFYFWGEGKAICLEREIQNHTEETGQLKESIKGERFPNCRILEDGCSFFWLRVWIYLGGR